MLAFRGFSGEVPRLPAHLLPDTAAAYANNCDFAHGELRGLKDKFLLQNMVNAVLGLWTEDGLNFLTWPEDINAVRGPVVDDSFQRLYYTSATDFRVTQRTQALPNGGIPAASWKAGVPRPTSAPTVNVVNRSALPDNITLAWKFFYESNGVKYQEQTITPATVTLGREYNFTPPLLTAIIPATTVAPTHDTPVTEIDSLLDATPDGALPCVEVTGTDTTGLQVFRAFSTNSTFSAGNDTTQMNGLDIEITVTSPTLLTVKFKYGQGFVQTRALVYTAVNIWSEESAPSDPVTASFDIMQMPRVTMPAVVATGYVPLASFRLYGSVTSTTGDTDYQLISEITNSGGAQINFDVTAKPANWTSLITTIGLLPPPAGMQGLCQMQNGIQAAFKGNQLGFCEPYKPWAYNPENFITLPYGIKSIMVSGSQLIVTTTAFPYIVSGSLPESMMERRLDAMQAGVNKNAICDCGSFVVYATHDGLCTITMGQAAIELGQKFFTREDWRARYGAFLSTMRLAYFDGMLIGYTPSGGGFVIRFDEATGTYSQFLSFTASAGFILPQTDSLYVAISNTVYQFAGGSSLAFEWRSKTFILPTPKNYGVLQVKGTGTTTVAVWAEDENGVDTLRATKVFTGNGTQKLPPGYKSGAYRLVITGSGVVKQLYLAETMQDLRNV